MLNLKDFVKYTVSNFDNFDKNNLDYMKKLVVKAIDFYKFRSYEESEKTQLGFIRFLHIHSVMEENLLSKIVDIVNSDKASTVEDVYEGYIIRYY